MATTDVFGRTSPPFAGGFSVDAATMTFPHLKDKDGNDINIDEKNPMILQSAQFAYQQPITRVYDLTTKGVFYIRGQASGQGQMSQIIGPAGLARAFVETFGSVCNLKDKLLQFTMDSGDCVDNNQATANNWDGVSSFIARYIVLNRVGIQMTAQQFIVQQDLSFEFGVLEYTTGAAETAAAPTAVP